MYLIFNTHICEIRCTYIDLVARSYILINLLHLTCYITYVRMCDIRTHKCVYSPFCTGVLATMWPCGIITSLSELYSAESKSLVYAYLHDFYNDCPDVSSNIRKYSTVP